MAARRVLLAQHGSWAGRPPLGRARLHSADSGRAPGSSSRHSLASTEVESVSAHSRPSCVAGGVVKDAITDGSSLGPGDGAAAVDFMRAHLQTMGCQILPEAARRLQGGPRYTAAPAGGAGRGAQRRCPAAGCPCMQMRRGAATVWGQNLPECQRVAATACGRCRGVGCGGGSCRWRSAAGSPAAQPSGVAVRPKPAIPDWGPPSLRGTPPSGRRDRGFQGRPRAAKVKGKGGEEPPQA